MRPIGGRGLEMLFHLLNAGRPRAPGKLVHLRRRAATGCVVAAWLFGNLTGLLPQARAGSGAPVWTNRYDGPANGSDYPYAVATDASDNVFVTGSTWDGLSDRLTIIKYSGGGVALWTNVYVGPGNGAGYGASVALDTNGSVYVTGSATGTNGYRDLVTIKYSNTGTALWTNVYDGPAHGDDGGSVVKLDGSGNVLVAGNSSNGASDDFVTLRYSSAGVPQWTNRYDGPGASTEWVSGVAADHNGTVFVAGTSYGGSSYYDFATLAYSAAGTPLWTNRYSGIGFSDDDSYGLAVDSAGNVFVGGMSRSGGQDAGFLLVKYSNAGVQLWTQRYDGPGPGDEYGYSMAMDADNDVIMTGPSYDGITWDYATVKFSNAGLPLWTNRYDGPAHGYDYASVVAVDSSRNVYVTGYSARDSGNTIFDFATVAYSSAGVPLWTNRFEGPGKYNEPLAIATDRIGNVIVTGYSDRGDGSYDWATVKYASSASAAPRLDYQVLNHQLVLSWTNASFHLQGAPQVTGVYTNLAGALSPYTNLVTGSQAYFRLQGN